MRADPELRAERARSRRRARRIMYVVSVICVAVALGLGAYQLHAEGLNQFLYRAPGVGASTPAAQVTDGGVQRNNATGRPQP